MSRALACVLVAACALPAAARADVASDATALRKSLNLGTLTGMPSGRTAYRSADDFTTELDALAAANPGFVAVKTAPYPSTEGRAVRYLEITNDVGAADGKPVFFLMGAIHGNESAGGEDDLEFAYDVVHQAATNPAVKALFDHVRLIDMPLVNPDGWAHNTRASATNTDLNRNYPFGWGSNIGVSLAQRGSGPGSEPEVRNTMAIVQSHQVVDLVTTHTNERAIFYPQLDVLAGDTPELNTGYRALALSLGDATANGYTNIRDSAHDYETSGETIDWAYYATRSLALTMELVGPIRGCPQSHPDYLDCTTADFTGTPGPTSTAAQTTAFTGHAVRDAFWQALAWASLPAGHAVIAGTAVPGATLKISKDFDLYTAPIKHNTTPATTSPPQAIPTHLESSLVVPASGRFSWDVNPSVRAAPAFRADGEVAGPNGFLNESYTITCTAPDGTLLDTEHVTVDRGQMAGVSLCTFSQSIGASDPLRTGSYNKTLTFTLSTTNP